LRRRRDLCGRNLRVWILQWGKNVEEEEKKELGFRGLVNVVILTIFMFTLRGFVEKV